MLAAPSREVFELPVRVVDGVSAEAGGAALMAGASSDVRELTVREFAEQERVTERQVRRWIKSGAVAVRRTPGGGIRILERRSSDSDEPPSQTSR